MPQMKPISWILLSIMCSLTMIIFSIIIPFSSPIKNLSPTHKNVPSKFIFIF